MAELVVLPELVSALRNKGGLPCETGLFIALETTEILLSTATMAPRIVALDDVRITAEGRLELRPPTAQMPSRAAARVSDSQVVVSLAALIRAIVAPLPAGAPEMLQRAQSGAIPTLGAMRAEIEALLVPLNRGAARRVLGRLARETLRTSVAERAVRPSARPAANSALDTVPDGGPFAQEMVVPEKVQPAERSARKVAPGRQRSASKAQPRGYPWSAQLEEQDDDNEEAESARSVTTLQDVPVRKYARGKRSSSSGAGQSVVAMAALVLVAAVAFVIHRLG